MMDYFLKQAELRGSMKLPVKKILLKAEELNSLEKAHLHEFIIARLIEAYKTQKNDSVRAVVETGVSKYLYMRNFNRSQKPSCARGCHLRARFDNFITNSP
jgi:hypothetical protein